MYFMCMNVTSFYKSNQSSALLGSLFSIARESLYIMARLVLKAVLIFVLQKDN